MQTYIFFIFLVGKSGDTISSYIQENTTKETETQS